MIAESWPKMHRMTSRLVIMPKRSIVPYSTFEKCRVRMGKVSRENDVLNTEAPPNTMESLNTNEILRAFPSLLGFLSLLSVADTVYRSDVANKRGQVRSAQLPEKEMLWIQSRSEISSNR